MPTDWNQKLAWVLRDQADDALDLLQISAQRSLFVSDDENIPEHPFGTWLRQGADRAPSPNQRTLERMRFDWSEHPEVTHALSKARHTFDTVELNQMRSALGELLKEAHSRFEGDARRTWLWIWRYLSDRLSEQSEQFAQIAPLIPADANQPNLSVWQRLAFDGALASAGDSPSFLLVSIDIDTDPLHAPNPSELKTRSALVDSLVWAAMVPIVEQLGPDAIVSPSLLNRPQVDAWLHSQGVSASAKDSTNDDKTPVGHLPSQFVALVPSEMVSELGNACKQGLANAWQQIASQARKQLESDRWGVKSDKAWSKLWQRQIDESWKLTWTAVPWLPDTTGAGNLVSKRDITSQEKWARLQEDASGLDEPWRGIFYGLWFAAVNNAGISRQRHAPAVWKREPSVRCTSCQQREAIHRKLSADKPRREELNAYWEKLYDGTKPSHGLLRRGERLCAVCATARILPLLEDAPAEASSLQAPDEDQQALVVLRPLEITGLLAGGKERRTGATIGSGLHSKVTRYFGKGRSRAKDIIESVGPLAPARQSSFENTFRNFSLDAVTELANKHEAHPLIQQHDLIVLTCSSNHVIALLIDLHETFSSAYATLGHPQRLASMPGPDVPLRADVVLGSWTELGGEQVEHLADRPVSTKGAKGGTVTLNTVRGTAPTPTWSGSWTDLRDSLGHLVELVGSTKQMNNLITALTPIRDALIDADLGKSASVRKNLVTSTIKASGVQRDEQLAADLASLVCDVVDASVKVLPVQEPELALESLRLATTLIGVAS